MKKNICKILYCMRYSLFSALWLFLLAANTVSGQIQLSFTTTQPTCNGYTDGTATVTATGGTAPYAYLWNNGQSGQTNFGLGAGTYSVTVTDLNSQTATGSVTVTQPGPLAVTFTTTGLSCTSTNGTLTANPTGGTQPYVYVWSTTATTQTISITTAGTYFVTVTDAKGCSKIDAYNVAPVAEFSASYSFNRPLCHGGATGSIGITVFGTNPAFTWVWNNGVQNQGLVNIPAGDYSVTITDSKGCTFADTVTLQDSPQLIVEIFATNSACSTLPNSGTVYAAVAGGVSPYTYVWSNGSNQPGQQGLPPGIYSVTVYDAHGCTATDTDTITIPPPLDGQIASLSPACGGNNGCITVTGIGGTPPYTYVWPVLGINGPTACGLAPGDYYVCIFDANGCQHDLIVTMTAIAGLDVTLVLTKAECPGVDNGTATVFVNPPTGTYTYQWIPQPNPSISQINSIPAGTTVSVTVTDINTGCMGTATGMIGSHNQVQVNVTDTDVFCVGDMTGNATAVATGGTTPYNYVWTLPDSTTVNGPIITGLGVGAYAVSVTDVKGCTAIGVADIGAQSNPAANYAHTVVDCIDSTVSIQITDNSTDPLSNIISWNWNISWSNGGNATSTQQNPPMLQFAENETVMVQLTVTSAQGCTALISAPFNVTGAPTVSLSVSDPAVDCNNGPIPITVTGGPGNTYNWFPLTGLIFNPDAQNVIANPAATTTYQLVAANGQCKDTLDVNVVRVQPINLVVQDTSIVTCKTTVPLTVTANAAANATIVWYNSNGDSIGTGSTIIVLANGQDTFSVTATDQYGCSQTDEVNVSGNSVDVSVSFGSTLSGCENAPNTLSVTNHDLADFLTYQWTSNPALNITPQGAASVTATGPAGTYTVSVLVKNQYGCDTTFTTQITVQPNQSLTDDIKPNLCNGLTVSFINGSDVSGTWHFGTNDSSTVKNPTYTYAQSGTYIVTFVSTEDCVLPFDTTITVLPESAVDAAFSNDYKDCTDQALIQFTDLSTHYYDIASWNWSFSPGAQTNTAQNPLITFTQEGMITATLIVKDVNGCADTTSAQINVSTLVIDLTDQSLCPGVSVPLNPNGNQTYGYNWTASPLDPTLVDANSPNPTVAPTVTTVYSVTITNGLFCSATRSVTATVYPAATVDLPANDTLCSSAPYTIIAQNTNGVTFTWSKNPNFNPPFPTNTGSLTITPEKNGAYYVMAVNAEGCTAVDSIKVNNGSVNIDAEPANRTICLGESTELTLTNLDAEDQLTYIWTPALDPIANPTVTPNTTTTYAVTATNQFGCSDTMHFNVNVISITVSAEVTGKDTICPGQSTELLATVTSNSTNITYEWTPSGSLTGANTANPTAAPIETTVYTVTATAEGRCPDADEVIVYFMAGECREPYIFVPKAFTPNNDGNNEFFIVRGADIKEVYFVVWDRWGEKVYETTDPQAQGWDGSFKGKDLTPDSYAWYVRVTCGNGEIYVNKGDVTLLK